MTEIPEHVEWMIEEFCYKHDLQSKDQALMLGAEVGELQDAILSEDEEGIREEMGDVLFVVMTLAYLEDVDWLNGLQTVTYENADKDASKDGSKVTKD